LNWAQKKDKIRSYRNTARNRTVWTKRWTFGFHRAENFSTEPTAKGISLFISLFLCPYSFPPLFIFHVSLLPTLPWCPNLKLQVYVATLTLVSHFVQDENSLQGTQNRTGPSEAFICHLGRNKVNDEYIYSAAATSVSSVRPSVRPLQKGNTASTYLQRQSLKLNHENTHSMPMCVPLTWNLWMNW